MLTTIAISAATGLAGILIGSTGIGRGRLSGRVGSLERQVAAVSQVVAGQISREEVSAAFAELAVLEDRRHQAAVQRMQMAPFLVNGSQAFWGQPPAAAMPRPSTPAPSAEVVPPGGTGVGLGDPWSGSGQVDALTAAVSQQLAALNGRMEQLTAAGRRS